MKDRLHFLDVARGIAAMLVLCAHTLAIYSPAYRQWAMTHVEMGRIGVLVFLVISGYIIPHSLQQGGSNARFWLRRFFRLFPLYWCAILLAYVRFKLIGITLVPPRDVGTWLWNLTMLQGFTGDKNVLGVFWTLHLELVIYIGCSILYQLRLLHRHWLLAGLGLLAYAGYHVYHPGIANIPLQFGGQQAFYVAALLGLVAHRLTTERQGMLKLIGLMLGHIALMAWQTDYGPMPDATFGQRFILVSYNWGVAYGLFLILLAVRDFEMPKFSRRLGVISYSVYLLHPILLSTMNLAWPGRWYFIPCVFLGSIAAGELGYRLIEVPGIALGRRLENWIWRPTIAVESARPVLLSIDPAPVPVRRAA